MLPFPAKGFRQIGVQDHPDTSTGFANVCLLVRWCTMAERSVEELRDELNRLMEEQMESLRKQTFGGLDDEELRQHEARLKRIRELSADFLAALKRSLL